MTNQLFNELVEYAKSTLSKEMPKNVLCSVFRGTDDLTLVVECDKYMYIRTSDGKEFYEYAGDRDDDD